jgi:hypothetical protein
MRLDRANTSAGIHEGHGIVIGWVKIVLIPFNPKRQILIRWPSSLTGSLESRFNLGHVCFIQWLTFHGTPSAG